jgi:Capsule assembly protein Wzi
VRTRLLLFLIAGAMGAIPLNSQTPPTTQPQQSVPAAKPAPPDSLPSLPGYGQDSTGQRQQNGPTPQSPGSVQHEPPAKPGPPPSTTPGAATPQEPVKAYVPYGNPNEDEKPDMLGSAYIPIDSWVYMAMTRLYSMGYVDTMYLSMRPWTRRSVLHMLKESEYEIVSGGNQEAQETLAALLKELEAEAPTGDVPRNVVYGMQSSYTRVMGVSGTTLRDSFHLGQTLYNDYGRPYESGFNNITGFSTLSEWWRFSLYTRGEYQHAPAGTGYSLALASQLSAEDGITFAPPNEPQATIPYGAIAQQDQFRLVEGTLSFHLLGHEISGGKSDAWLSPAAGGSLGWSNNAENIYSFRINRVEPLRIPFVSRFIGKMRYDFFYGSLKGHTSPNDPWVHAEMFSFAPTSNLQFSFERTIIFGGKGHEPVTLHTFLVGFFSASDSDPAQKLSRADPGARYSTFSFSYRIPLLRKYVTFIADSIAHDDVSPISAPRRAAFRTGFYITQLPKLPKLDLRFEVVDTDPDTGRSQGGYFNYYEVLQRQGYTNKGIIMGDWIGREAKGGQAWLTYHLSPREWIQLEYLNKKIPNDFIPNGTTQNQFKASVVKRLGKDIELNAWVQYEKWKAPVYKTGAQSNTIEAFQVTWYPKLHTDFKDGLNFR